MEMETILAIAVGLVFMYFIISLAARSWHEIGMVHSRWFHYFDGLKHSSQDFYSSLDALVKSKGIPDISVKRANYSQTAVFSASREYLRIQRGDYIFLVCAAPFANGYFISWWFGERVTIQEDILSRVPVFGHLFLKLIKTRTYYQLDTEAIFKEFMRTCILKCIEEMSTAKGIRALSELELQPNDVPKQFT